MTGLRFKDIAREIGLTTRDFMQLCRELGIQVKSQMHSFEAHEVAAIRAEHAKRTSTGSKVDTQVATGVKVRRRTKASDDADQAADEGMDADLPLTEAEGLQAKASEAPATEAQPEPVEPHPIPVDQFPEFVEAAKRADEEAIRPPQQPKSGRAPKVKVNAAPARIISKPVAEQEEVVSEPVKPEVQAVAETKPVEAPAKTESVAETVVVAPEVKAEADKPAESVAEQPKVEAVSAETKAVSDEAGEEAKPKAEAPAAAGAPSQVRIISKPAATDRPAGQARVISRPTPPPPGAPAAPGGYRPTLGGPGPGGPRGPGGPGAPGGYRPTLGGPRAPGGAPGGFRPTLGGPRGPGGPGGPAGARPGTPPPPAPTGDDRRKGVKKDKRVVDFSAGRGDDNRRGGGRRKDGSFDRSGGSNKFGKKKNKRPQDMVAAEAAAAPMKQEKRKIRVDESIRVGDLAHGMGVKAQDVIKVLFGLGVMATINASLDFDTATLAAGEFGYEVEKVGFSSEDALAEIVEVDDPEALRPRPPVVTIMGHVDHGKTSLLDAIRTSDVVLGEAGGITQHIGAYHVNTPRGEIVFLDTPGHEAFTAMRARGAQVTDVVVLVVAADDGVMDQTREAVNHAKAAGVPIVVAVNKIDKEGANPDRVRRELGDLGLVPEDWGGDTIFAPVSAKKKLGIDELLEMILLQSEVLALKANPSTRARGRIVEARLDKGRGPVATVLVQNGTLHQGDAFVCGTVSGRIRALFDDTGKKIKEAGPSMPVEVQGLETVPEAGDEFVVLEDEKLARRIADQRAMKQRERELGKATKLTLETFLATRGEAEAAVLKLVLKTDVQGSLEAIADALHKLSTDKVKVQIIHSGAGGLTESDVLLAAASQAIIIGFHVRPNVKVRDLAESEGVDIRYYDIIYKLVADIKDAMSGLLAPVMREVYLGQAEVRQVFNIPRVGLVAGLYISDGKMTRNAGVRLLRDGVVVYTGKLSSLRRFKDDVKEVTKGYECGGSLENYTDLKVGDIIEAFENVEEKATL